MNFSDQRNQLTLDGDDVSSFNTAGADSSSLISGLSVDVSPAKKEKNLIN